MIVRNAFISAILAALAATSSVPVRADTYALDPDHTEVRFTWDHLGLSRQGGRFTTAAGTLSFDPSKPEASTIEVKIPVKSLSTGIKKLDEHLINTKDFFDVVANPAITFKSTLVRMKSDKTGEVEGDLSINGVSKPVVLDVVWNFSGEHPLQAINPVYAGAFASGFSASTQIRRSDWGITRTIPYVSDELRITIETELLRTAVSPVADVATPTGDGGQPSGTEPSGTEAADTKGDDVGSSGDTAGDKTSPPGEANGIAGDTDAPDAMKETGSGK